jgi:hypothetical protein
MEPGTGQQHSLYVSECFQNLTSDYGIIVCVPAVITTT